MNKFADKPYVVEFEDGTFMIFKNIKEYQDSKYYDRDDWLMVTYAEWHSEPSESPVRLCDDCLEYVPSHLIEGR